MIETAISLTPAITDIEHRALAAASSFDNGPAISPIKRLLTYESGEWEAFIHEWIHSLKHRYVDVVRPTGPGDKGLDVVGFEDNEKLKGVWDNHQCKFYKDPLAVSDVVPEIGKIIVYSFQGFYSSPRSVRFISPKGPSTDLALHLGNADKLKQRVKKDWAKAVESKISTKETFPLASDLETYFDAFEFKIFSAPHPLAVIDEHKKTPFFWGRFGGGLPDRPKPTVPPIEVEPHETPYTGKLLQAYGEHLDKEVSQIGDLTGYKSIFDHFSRARERFDEDESFRVFVRDKTAPGTFESLQDEIYDVVVDTCEQGFSDGLARVNAVTERATTLPLDAHPLNKATFVKDRKGICHQLANDDRLTWKK
jgi:hypothetical protein